MNQKYILTGAPGTGKTSIILELKRRGYSCIEENSREIISDQIQKKGEILPWKNQIAFENKIAQIRMQKYINSPKNEICFFDRSIIDSIAYLKFNNLDVTSQIIDNVKNSHFNKTVFLTPIWEEIYINDNERKENIKQAIQIGAAIIKAYHSRGYKLLEIPKISVKERSDFIIANI